MRRQAMDDAGLQKSATTNMAMSASRLPARNSKFASIALLPELREGITIGGAVPRCAAAIFPSITTMSSLPLPFQGAAVPAALRRARSLFLVLEARETLI